MQNDIVTRGKLEVSGYIILNTSTCFYFSVQVDISLTMYTFYRKMTFIRFCKFMTLYIFFSMRCQFNKKYCAILDFKFAYYVNSSFIHNMY